MFSGRFPCGPIPVGAGTDPRPASCVQYALHGFLPSSSQEVGVGREHHVAQSLPRTRYRLPLRWSIASEIGECRASMGREAPDNFDHPEEISPLLRVPTCDREFDNQSGVHLLIRYVDLASCSGVLLQTGIRGSLSTSLRPLVRECPSLRLRRSGSMIRRNRSRTGGGN